MSILDGKIFAVFIYGIFYCNNTVILLLTALICYDVKRSEKIVYLPGSTGWFTIRRLLSGVTAIID